MQTRFSNIDVDAAWALIDRNPLAWLVPRADPAMAILMPVRRGEGKPRTLEGHLPKASPIADFLDSNEDRISVLFMGPNAYISPRVVGIDEWAPTWNFASVKVSGHAHKTPDQTDAILKRICAHMEGDVGPEWIGERMGERFDGLATHVVGFVLEVESVIPRFKLGQDETPEVKQRIIDSLGEDPLGAMMANSQHFDDD